MIAVRKVITIDFLLWNYYYEYNLMEKLERLKKKITQKGNLLVAFSGGVDSGLLLKVAHDVLKTVSMKLKTLGFNYVTLDL